MWAKANQNTVEVGSLPDLSLLGQVEIAGPLSKSNWCIPGRVIQGAFPSAATSDEQQQILDTLITKNKVNVFINLVPEEELSRFNLLPYEEIAVFLNSNVEIVNFPTVDGTPFLDVSGLVQLLQLIKNKVAAEGNVVYIHCRGGHGRAGIVTSCLLGMCYGISSTVAMNYISKFHDWRVDTENQSSPQYQDQRNQVHAVYMLK